MKILSFVILFFMCDGISSQASGSSRKFPEVDYLLEELQKEKWIEDVSCYRAMVEMLHGVKNSTLWASWIWDAMQRPTGTLYGTRYQLGNYDQCLNPPWKSSHPNLQTQYCIVDVKLSQAKPKERGILDPYASTYKYIETKNDNGRRFDIMTIGVCLPTSCGTREASSIAQLLTGLPPQNPDSTLCERRAINKHDWKLWAFIAMLGILSSLTILGTYYSKTKETYGEESLSIGSLAKSVCLIKNFNDLTKQNGGEIKILHGMRFLTALNTVLMHEMMYLIISPLSNALDYDKDVRTQMTFLIHIEVMIDTFFAMAGLLFMKGLLSSRSGEQNLLLVLLKRYFRLIGPFAVTTYFSASIVQHVGDGPLWTKLNEKETEYCSKYWWLNLLMANTDLKTMCYGVTWYISADYQLAVLATIIFFAYRKNKKAGYIGFGMAFIMSAVIPGLLTYMYNYPITPFEKFHTLADLRHNEGINQVYVKSYSRAGAYLVGVAMGFIMTLYKPSHNRNVIPKIWSYFGSAVCLITMAMVLSLGGYFITRDYNALEAAIIGATNRSVWAVAICGLIAFSEYGSIPLISDFLGWKVFVPLSRLSYGIYLIHPLFIQRKYFSARSPFKYDYVDIAFDVFGVTVIAAICSVFLWLVVEAPLINLSNQFLSTRPKHLVNGSQNGHAVQNGKHKTL